MSWGSYTTILTRRPCHRASAVRILRSLIIDYQELQQKVDAPLDPCLLRETFFGMFGHMVSWWHGRVWVTKELAASCGSGGRITNTASRKPHHVPTTCSLCTPKFYHLLRKTDTHAFVCDRVSQTFASHTFDIWRSLESFGILGKQEVPHFGTGSNCLVLLRGHARLRAGHSCVQVMSRLRPSRRRVLKDSTSTTPVQSVLRPPHNTSRTYPSHWHIWKRCFEARCLRVAWVCTLCCKTCCMCSCCFTANMYRYATPRLFRLWMDVIVPECRRRPVIHQACHACGVKLRMESTMTSFVLRSRSLPVPSRRAGGHGASTRHNPRPDLLGDAPRRGEGCEGIVYDDKTTK